MTDAEEKLWLAGNRAALVSMIAHCVRELGYEGRTAESLIVEREAAVAALRRVCEEHGDNDWSDDLHLADVVEKHLGRHLEVPE